MLAFSLMSVLPVHAQAPAEMSYQGYLEDRGIPVNDSNATLTFHLFDIATGGSPLWSETHTGVDVANGIFAVTLGAVTSLNSLEFYRPLWVEVEVERGDGSSMTFAPRTPLAASPYTMGLVLPILQDASVGGTALTINNTGSGDGIKGETQTATGRGIVGQASAFTGQNAGVYGESRSEAGTGVYGLANTSVATETNYGVYGKSNSETGYGVYGEAPKIGVYGMATAGTFDAFGVRGNASGSSTAVYGLASGSGMGVFGHNIGVGRAGRFEINNTGNGSEALFAWTNGTGAAGRFEINRPANTSNVLEAITNGSGYALYAQATAQSAIAGFFEGSVEATGRFEAPLVLADEVSTDQLNAANINATKGVFTDNNQAAGDKAVYIEASGGDAVGLDIEYFGDGVALRVLGSKLGSGRAASFTGNVDMLGTLNVNGTKNFKIDHPLDPANKYLYHFAIESSEVLNIYSGTVRLDGAGEATVELPSWFEALNTDIRYQLTPIGAPGPNLHIAEKVQRNRFKIAGGTSGMEVSWQVTGVRNDPGLRSRPHPVEQDKPPEARGTYLSPEAYGISPEQGLRDSHPSSAAKAPVQHDTP